MFDKIFRCSMIFGGAVGCISNSLMASVFVNAVSPSEWTRPADNTQAIASLTTYQEWDGFNSAAGPNAPTAAANPNAGTPDAYDAAAASDGAFLIGSPGDIYSFGAVIKPVVIVPGYNIAGDQLNVQVEIQSYGSLISVDDLNVNGIPATSLDNYSHTEVYNDGGADNGFGVAYTADEVWTFSLPDTALLDISWGWDVESSAWQVASVDTQSAPLPEPASLALLILGAILIRRKRA
ncbi:MAG TPA: PEP-CTERM sorting domain-containing protein [Tepidisphaeraceae bacterium]|nr:PEP-CTERM sorting domain-containing protein [Tepidisphaeraceae bacterium]